MGIEIERKFLVAGDGWRAAAEGPAVPIRQGYLSAPGAGGATIRIRRAGPAAFLTVKGPGGLVRAEFEYPIPPEDAEAMLALCTTPPLAKARWSVPHAGHLWTVDVFEAPASLAGLVLAEVEMESADADPPLPAWLGREVTQDGRYANAALIRDGIPD
ncbi:CYTH domain-containing protein [Falsiroseomonas ponticola]|uniref:CYTH domain-containing protein n=1 Tax=Falsiroseomonas ponticola TaxID=2786951 RepID=UPI0019346E8C|nr:CYTH domain-containing protein [Roseomonas ponticola]